MSYKKMGKTVLILTLCFLTTICTLTVVFDPYFHFHAPYDGVGYVLDKERYQNDGISRHFDYDTIITGTSMTENFKTSECDKLFDAKTIKIPRYGASFKEINDSIDRALDYNPNVKRVIRCLDTYRFFEDKDAMLYDCPEYLYDSNPFNDVSYVFNKDVLLGDVYPVAMSTLHKLPPTSFDDYASWDKGSKYGKEVVLADYKCGVKPEKINFLTEEEKSIVLGTVEQNILQTAKSNPNVEFYLFLPPYSVVYWDSLNAKGDIQKNLDAQEIAIRMMLECDNIYVYSFLTDYATVCDLGNYKDTVHYSGAINTQILNSMKNNDFLITINNCEDYFDAVKEFYVNYDYASIDS